MIAEDQQHNDQRHTDDEIGLPNVTRWRKINNKNGKKNKYKVNISPGGKSN